MNAAADSSVLTKALLDKQGFAIVPHVLDTSTVVELTEALQVPLSSNSAGTRNLANTVQAVGRLAHSASVRKLIEPVLGKEARLVRSVLFKKTPAVNWQVAWHQDLSIAVQQKVEVEGFGQWSIKDGVHHVQPPTSVLENMLTVRLHLDDADEANGALRVLPGSIF